MGGGGAPLTRELGKGVFWNKGLSNKGVALAPLKALVAKIVFFFFLLEASTSFRRFPGCQFYYQALPQTTRAQMQAIVRR